MKRFAIFALFVLSGCGSPEVNYYKAKPDDESSLKDGDLIFKMRSTNITLAPPPAAGSKIASTTDVCSGKSSSTECVNGVTVTATPVSYGDSLIAKPNDGWLDSTKFSAQSDDNDPELVQTVSVTFKDESKDLITSTSAGAVAGFSLGGPWGAAGGGLIAAVGAIATANGEAGGEKHTLNFPKLVCGVKPASINAQDYAHPQALTFVLPVVIGLNDYPINEGCWHLVQEHTPLSDGDALAGQGNGWLYRLTLGDAPGGSTSIDGFLSVAGDVAKPRRDYPYTPCQNATLELAWWNEVDDALKSKPGVDVKLVSFKHFTYRLKVANPAYVKIAPLPKAGSIKLGSVCGATVQYVNYAGPTISDDFSALMKAATDIKSAQDSYNKAKTAK